jgi:sigma-B regulation protein RsbU (phosphoserine phosphatase)
MILEQKSSGDKQSDPLIAVSLTNDYIAQDNEMSMFVTLFFGVLNPKNGQLFYVNGGHEAVFIIDQEGVRERLLPTGPSVGIFEEAKFTYKEIQLQPGEILFAYTDGVIDARTPDGDRFSKRRLDALLSQPVDNALDLMQRIATSLFAHIGLAPQEDDITMLTIQRKNSNKSV